MSMQTENHVKENKSLSRILDGPEDQGSVFYLQSSKHTALLASLLTMPQPITCGKGRYKDGSYFRGRRDE
jgi:hypothetical protein